MLEDQLSQLQGSARERIESAADPDALETVRVEVLGRKGTLAQFSKDMAKLSPEQRASVGKTLNAAKQSLETAFEAKKARFESDLARGSTLNGSI